MPKNGFEKKYFDQLPNIGSPFKNNNNNNNRLYLERVKHFTVVLRH